MIDITGLECPGCGNSVLFDREEYEEIDDGGGDTHKGRPILECRICERQYYYSRDEFKIVHLEEA